MRVTAILLITAMFAVPPTGQAQSDLANDYADAVSKLRAIGIALGQYAADHPTNSWPERLTNLVAQGYLDASILVCTSDYSNGTQGGVPDAGVSGFAQYPEVDESGSSFFMVTPTTRAPTTTAPSHP